MNVGGFREFAGPAPGANRHSESSSRPLHRTILAALDTILREFHGSLIGLEWQRGSEKPSGSIEVAALELPLQEVLMNLIGLLVYNLAVPDIAKLRSRFVRR
jgi:hypothetical protein